MCAVNLVCFIRIIIVITLVFVVVAAVVVDNDKKTYEIEKEKLQTKSETNFNHTRG